MTKTKANAKTIAAELAAQVVADLTDEQVATIAADRAEPATEATDDQPKAANAMPANAPQGWARTDEQPLHYSSPVGNARPLLGYVVPTMATADQTVLAHARSAAYKAFAPGSGGALAVALHSWCAVKGLPAQAAVVIAYNLRNVPGLYYPNAPYTAPGSWQQKFASAPFTKGVAPAVCCAVTQAHAAVWEAYVASNPAAQAAHASIAGLPAWRKAEAPEQGADGQAAQAA